MYANDNTFLVTALSIPTVLEASSVILSRVNGCCRERGLIVNLQKTECVVFSTPRSVSSLLMIGDSDHEISVSETVKFLGVCLDRHLRWDVHINTLKKKLNGVSFMLYMLRNQVTFICHLYFCFY
ncbi:hypothetical protein WA026_022209 [Henosepilachna vigintioctopunctata]|uniref:Reverse transcriptase domain-containing protein n=1 Tax=Henosepilachna vigintioctopunctata TaxID=420089 RepID=A0AAW1UN29_9CUCU